MTAETLMANDSEQLSSSADQSQPSQSSAGRRHTAQALIWSGIGCSVMRISPSAPGRGPTPGCHRPRPASGHCPPRPIERVRTRGRRTHGRPLSEPHAPYHHSTPAWGICPPGCGPSI